VALAGLMGVERVVMMSRCPGGPGDANANWVTTSWPPETQAILRYQWDDVLIPYWRELVAYARRGRAASAAGDSSRRDNTLRTSWDWSYLMTSSGITRTARVML
jgi:hypothetical protein